MNVKGKVKVKVKGGLLLTLFKADFKLALTLL